jgi:hypothetical protein
MNAAACLVALYPPGVRDRWGRELQAEVAESGVRCWPDTVAGAIRLWLCPSEWPEKVVGQTRRVVALVLFGLTAVTALVLRAAQPTPAVTADLSRPATSLWLLPLLSGLALATPVPPLRRAALRQTSIEVLRTLAAPSVAVMAVFVLAYSGLAEHPAARVHVGLICYYWATLGFVAWRLCRVIARVGRLAAAANPRRLRAALLLTGTGAVLGAGQALVSLATAPAGGTLAIVVALSILAGMSINSARDLVAARDTHAGPSEFGQRRAGRTSR